MIYVDRKNHFDEKGQFKPLEQPPPEFRALEDATKVVPRVFGTDDIANLLRHCKNQPEVERKVCESAKDAVDEKGEIQ